MKLYLPILLINIKPFLGGTGSGFCSVFQVSSMQFPPIAQRFQWKNLHSNQFLPWWCAYHCLYFRWFCININYSLLCFHFIIIRWQGDFWWMRFNLNLIFSACMWFFKSSPSLDCYSGFTYMSMALQLPIFWMVKALA